MCTESALNKITSSITLEALQLFSDRLHSIILYGSYARNDFDSESDIDIMLLLNIRAEKINSYCDEIAKLSSRLSLESEDCVTVSIVMQDTETFEKYRSVLPFFKSVSKEGVILYAA